jgi:hypothetical protein
MRKTISVILTLAIIAAIVIFIPGPKVHAKPAPEGASGAGFVSGVWNGLMLPLNLIRSIFYTDASILDTHNSGKWYIIGFVIGAIVIVFLLFLIIIIPLLVITFAGIISVMIGIMKK